MSNEMVATPIDQIGMMAKAVADSGIFGIKNEAAAFALMCVAQSEGIPPIQAAVQYHVIDGKPALKSEAMLTRFQAAGGSIKWKERNAQRCTLWLKHPQAGELEVTWDMDRAKAAGLSGKNTWRAYPQQMMSARCISEGVRALYPACLSGCYTPEEVRDFDAVPPQPAPEPKKAPQPAKEPAETPQEAPKAGKPAKSTAKVKKATKDAEIVNLYEYQHEHQHGTPEHHCCTCDKVPEEDVILDPPGAPESPKAVDPLETKRRNFVLWTAKAAKEKGDDAVMAVLGANGFENAEDVPADLRILRKVTEEILEYPDLEPEIKFDPEV